MSKARDPNYKQGNKFSDEELNPNRPHNYRKEHGESPVGKIQEVLDRMDPEKREEMEKKRVEKIKATKSMKKRAKEILEMAITLSPEEREGYLKGLKVDGEITVQDAMLYGQVTKSITEKDTAATVFMRDTSGQKPKEEVEHKVNIEQLLKSAGALDEEDLDEEDDLDED